MFFSIVYNVNLYIRTISWLPLEQICLFFLQEAELSCTSRSFPVILMLRKNLEIKLVLVQQKRSEEVISSYGNFVLSLWDAFCYRMRKRMVGWMLENLQAVFILKLVSLITVCHILVHWSHDILNRKNEFVVIMKIIGFKIFYYPKGLWLRF